MTEGNWTCSTNEEHWDCGEEFDTREEALAYAINGYASEHSIEDGDSVWIGQIKAVDLDTLSENGADAWNVIDSMSEWLYANVGDFAQDSLDCSKEQERDLDARLARAIREWMDAHGIRPSCWLIDYVERHVWEQCEAKHDEHDNPRGRCVLAAEHEGVHEFP